MAETEGSTPQAGLLLKTKFFVSTPRPNLLRRPRLTERLNEALRLGHKLTLVSAPAGFGKTTLLGFWIADLRFSIEDTATLEPDTKVEHRESEIKNRKSQIANRVAWVSLDEGDNDPARFLAYLIGALQTLDAGIGEGMLNTLQSPQPPPIEPLLTALINQVVALPAVGDAAHQRYVLVLDDYHVIKAQAIHGAVSFLLDHLPPQLHLVIASRSDPVLPLARLRGRGQLTEVRITDLRFTPAEAADFLNDVMGIALSAEDVSALEERTEGWITGLQLAALSLQGHDVDHISDLIKQFAGSNRFVLDYLVEEVLQQQPAELQTFLLQTSILERLCGPLCDAVTGDQETRESGTASDSQAVIEQLETANLFIVALDEQRRWYRYHRLFADLLRARLSRIGPQVGCAPADELHRRASAWYEHNGFTDNAVSHALAAQDFDRAARLVQGRGLQMLLRGELTTLLGWLAALPGEPICRRPLLCIYHAWALTLTGQVDAAESRLQDALDAMEQVGAPAASASGDENLKSEIENRKPEMLGHVAAIRAYGAAATGDVLRTIELANRALSLLPEKELVVRSVVAFTLGATHLVNGDVAAASHAFAQASSMGQAAGNLNLAVSAMCHTAGLQAERGQLGLAAETHRQARNLATGPSGNPLPIAAQSYSGLGALAYEWNDLQTAAQQLEKGIELGRRWGNVEALAADYGELARVYQAQGKPERAVDALRTAEQLSHEHALAPGVPVHVTAYWPRLWLAQGNLAAAERWAQEHGPSHAGEPTLVNEFEYLTLARILIVQGQVGRAQELLARLLALAEQGERMGRAVEVLALQALAHQAEGDSTQAMASLQRALSLAEPEGYVRVFVDEGEPMADLLSAFSRQHSAVSRGYVAKLLAAFPKSGPKFDVAAIENRKSEIQNLAEPLSEREMEVLRLVAAGLTNQEIADRLVIAVSTVKSHTNSIYGKLGVKNRTQAVAMADSLSLL
jgi:LuxR family maltose regulon positive regulatory protein